MTRAKCPTLVLDLQTTEGDLPSREIPAVTDPFRKKQPMGHPRCGTPVAGPAGRGGSVARSRPPEQPSPRPCRRLPGSPHRARFPHESGLVDLDQDQDDKPDHHAVRQPEKSPTTGQGEELFVMFPRLRRNPPKSPP